MVADLPDYPKAHANCGFMGGKPVRCDRCATEYICTPSADYYCAAEGDHCCEPCLQLVAIDSVGADRG